MTEAEQGIIRKPAVKGRKFIAVDLDGTLAFYDRHVSRTHIGEPIEKMTSRVRQWLNQGHVVIIFTSRVADERKDNSEVYAAIHAWCEKQFGERLLVTATKHSYFSEIWDDRAFSVGRNTGELIA